jgi:hypothetical protein
MSGPLGTKVTKGKEVERRRARQQKKSSTAVPHAHTLSLSNRAMSDLLSEGTEGSGVAPLSDPDLAVARTRATGNISKSHQRTAVHFERGYQGVLVVVFPAPVSLEEAWRVVFGSAPGPSAPALVNQLYRATTGMSALERGLNDRQDDRGRQIRFIIRRALEAEARLAMVPTIRRVLESEIPAPSSQNEPAHQQFTGRLPEPRSTTPGAGTQQGANKFQGPDGDVVDPKQMTGLTVASGMRWIAVGGAWPNGYPLVPFEYDTFLNLTYVADLPDSVVVERSGAFLEVALDDIRQYVRLTPWEMGVWSARIWAVVYPWLARLAGDILMLTPWPPAIMAGMFLYRAGEEGLLEAAEAGIPEAEEILEKEAAEEDELFGMAGTIQEPGFKPVAANDALAEEYRARAERQLDLSFPRDAVLEANWIGRTKGVPQEISNSLGFTRHAGLYFRTFRDKGGKYGKLLTSDNRVTPEFAEAMGWKKWSKHIGEQVRHHHTENGAYVVPVPESKHTRGTRHFERSHQRESYPKPGSEPKFRKTEVRNLRVGKQPHVRFKNRPFRFKMK